MTKILTDIGETKLAFAAGSASQVAICEVALGDGLGVTYEPTHDQTELRRELAREPVGSRNYVGGDTWRVRTEFGTDTPVFNVREVGYFDEDGDLIAIVAGHDYIVKETGAVVYLTEQLLNFSRVAEGLITINAPDDGVFEMLRNQATANFLIMGEQVRQALAIEALEGAR